MFDLDVADAIANEGFVSEKDVALRQTLRRHLSLQSLESADKRQAALAEDQEWAVQARETAKKAEQEERRRQRRAKETLAAFNASCDKIVAAKQRRLRREFHADVSLEKQVMDVARDRARREAAEEEEAKRRKKEAMAAIEENRKLAARLKSERVREQQLEDVRLMKAQAEMLEKQDVERANHYERLKSTAKTGRAHHPSVVQKTLPQMASEDLVRTTLEDKVIHGKELKRAEDRRSMLKQHADDACDAFQMHHCKVALREEAVLEQKKQEADQLRSSLSAADAKDREKRRLQQERINESAEYLRTQMSTMPAADCTLNSEQLKRAREGGFDTQMATRSSLGARSTLRHHSNGAPKAWAPYATCLGKSTPSGAVGLLQVSRSSWRHPLSLSLKERPVEPEPQLPLRRSQKAR